MSGSINYVPVGVAPPVTKPPPPGFSGMNQISEPPTYAETYRGLYPSDFTHKEGQTYTSYDVVPVHLTREKTWLVCPYCYKQTMTIVDGEYSMGVNCCTCLLCVIGWPCCCCIAPYYLAKPIKVEHYCSECHQHIGEAYEDNSLLRERLDEIRRDEGN